MEKSNFIYPILSFYISPSSCAPLWKKNNKGNKRIRRDLSDFIFWKLKGG